MSTERKIMQFPVKSPYHPETAEKVLRAFKKIPGDPQWLADLRQAGVAYVTQYGLPTPKLEGWKFTNIIPAVKHYEVLGQASVTTKVPPQVQVQPIMQSIEQDWVRELIMEAAAVRDPNTDPTLWHLCNMFFRDGVSVDVPANAVVKEPLKIVMEGADGAFYNDHTVIRVGVNASLTIIEDHRGKGKFWKNRLCHITLEPGAHMTHIRIQDDSTEAVYTQTTKVSIARDAHYNAVALYTGAAISRNQVHVLLKEPGALCHINGAALMRGKQHADTTILVEHLAPHCESNQNMRTILDDQAHGVFQGKVHVHQPAQKTDGYQLSKALLLSEGAEMDTKPELEIYADDVKCSHGATTGRLDEEPLFYMQSRGIPVDAARALLIEAFADEVFDEVQDEKIKEELLGRVRAWLIKT
ncbi:MAG: Fe-S cluster assembly protein SufD [Micavibrio sp.]